MNQRINDEAYEALEYFYGAGMIDNCTRCSQRHFVEAMMKYVAAAMNVELAPEE